MWADYFGYEYCVARDTLFIKGISADGSRSPFFAMPIGPHNLADSVNAIKAYCRKKGIGILFSAITEEVLEKISPLGATEVTELADWADYIYRAEDLATLSGKAYNKKRNHVNRFMADNPEWVLEPLKGKALDDAREFFAGMDSGSYSLMAEYERKQCANILRHYSLYPFEGAVLRGNGGKVVAFTVAEIIGDTLIVHIEKMNHDVSGAGESINKLFAAEMLMRYPGLKYINREDDAGDPGLRKAKQSYHPVAMLRKFNVTL